MNCTQFTVETNTGSNLRSEFSSPTRIGLYPGAEGYCAVFDYTIGEDATDYILVVEFDNEGEVYGISMDS